MLNRCVPDITGNLTERVVQFLNNDDLARKVLSDLFSTWKEMLALCFIALGKSNFFITIYSSILLELLLWNRLENLVNDSLQFITNFKIITLDWQNYLNLDNI